MNIAFPIDADDGLNSKISANFGSVREYLVVNLETKAFENTKNQKYAAESATCKSGKFDPALPIDAVITKCIGNGSLRDMNTSGIKVYQAQKDLVIDNLKLLEKGALKLFHIFDVCQGHKNKKDHGCGHHH